MDSHSIRSHKAFKVLQFGFILLIIFIGSWLLYKFLNFGESFGYDTKTTKLINLEMVDDELHFSFWDSEKVLQSSHKKGSTAWGNYEVLLDNDLETPEVTYKVEYRMIKGQKVYRGLVLNSPGSFVITLNDEDYFKVYGK